MKNKFSLVQKFTACLMLAAMFSPAFSVVTSAQQMSDVKAKAVTEDQKILHVLNRLGFGARPGDVDRVKAIGLNKYIEQQLNPALVDDAVAESKVRNLQVLKMSNEELFDKYPRVQTVLGMVARQNGSERADVAAIRNRNLVRGAEGGATMPENSAGNIPNSAQMSDDDRQRVQREIAEAYGKYNLGRPPQITQQLSAARILRAVYSERQLQEVMVDFWTNHFNVYANKESTRWFLPEYDRDVIRPNALGNFRDLLLATAKSPAMLFYLDNFQSVSPNAQANNRRANQQQTERAMENPQMRRDQMPQAQQRQQRGINENYARELMELHTLGSDGGYTQKDIGEVARAFTGWTIVDPRAYRLAARAGNNGTEAQRAVQQMRRMGIPENTPTGSFYFNKRVHDNGEKIVLGQKVNEGGMKDGLKVIDILANHPSTAKFIARKLAVKFVSDNPSEALVGRVANAFQKSKGDIKTTLRSLFNDPEFFAPENYRAKIKTPFELVISSIRTVGADTNGFAIQGMLAKMGETLYGYRAPIGYPDMAEDWVNTGALLARINFAVALASNRIPGTRVNLTIFARQNKQEILNKAVANVLNGEISPNTKAALLKQLEQPLPEPKTDNASDDAMMENAAMDRPNGEGDLRRSFFGGGTQTRLLAPSGNPEVYKVVGLIIGSPDFQKQ